MGISSSAISSDIDPCACALAVWMIDDVGDGLGRALLVEPMVSSGHWADGGGTVLLRVLGSVELAGPNGPVLIGGRRERAVLTALALVAGEVVSVDRLADVVWGDRAPPSSAKVVQNIVLRLRKTIGPDVIETRPPGYLLRVDRDAIDCHRFSRLWRQGRARSVAGDHEGAVVSLVGACELWRGPPPADLGDVASGRGAALRLQEEYRDTLEELADVSLTLGRHVEWAPTLEAMVIDEPLRERRWALLMLALHGCGRQADALRAFQRARAALADVGLEPGPALKQLERRIGTRDDSVLDRQSTPSVAVGNLTVPLTRWIGPPDDLRQRALDVTSWRLVTITGSGGVGKTRLAVETGRHVRGQFPGGVWFIDLAPIVDPAAVVGVVAATIGLRSETPVAAVDAIVERLMLRQRALLIFDNCEQVTAQVAAVVAAVVSRCPSTTVLVTSREPLGLAGERVITLASMRLTDAVELFCERARSVDDTTIVTETDRTTIEAICRRLDGIPLAIELAAGRMRSCTPTDILERLDDRFRLLQGGSRDGPQRHQTLRATVAWSYQLLDPEARSVFERASVFAGGFDADAAHAVLADGHGHEIDVVARLDDLVRTSMLVADRGGDRVRYRLLETLRHFGEEQLGQRDELADLRRRHLAHYLGVAGRADRLWASPSQAEADAVFEQEWHNLRAAHGWARLHDIQSAELLIAVTGAYALAHRRDDHGVWALRTLDVLGADGAGSPSTHGWAALWLYLSHDFDQALTLALRGDQSAESRSEPAALLCRCTTFQAQRSMGDIEASRVMAAEVRAVIGDCPDAFMRNLAYLALVEQAFWCDLKDAGGLVAEYSTWAGTVGAPSISSTAASCSGRVKMWAQHPPDFIGAIDCYEHGLALARVAGDVGAEISNLLGLAFAHTAVGSADAPEACRIALTALRQTGSTHGIFLLLDAVARWFLVNGAIEPAAVISGYLEGGAVPTSDRDHDDAADRRHTILRRPDGHELLARGAGMSSDEAVAYTLIQMRDAPHRSPRITARSRSSRPHRSA